MSLIIFLSVGYSERIKSLSPTRQKFIISRIIENRKNIKSHNTAALFQELLAIQADSELAEIWFKDFLEKIVQLNQLYNLTSCTIDLIDKEKKSELKRELNKLCVKNLDSITKIRLSLMDGRFIY